jgi:hypothetical protein
VSGGRAARQPGAGYQPPQRVFISAGECRVRCFPERGGEPVDVDLSVLPVAGELREWLAHAVAGVTGPSGTRRTATSARDTSSILLRFTRHLASLDRPPTRPQELRRAHVDGFILRGGKALHRDLPAIRSILRFAPEPPPEEFWTRLTQARTPKTDDRVMSYTEAEFTLITTRARADLRAAVSRIRQARAALDGWRAGAIDPGSDPHGWEAGWLLDHIDRHGDVPRQPQSRADLPQPWVVRHGGAVAAMARLHLSYHDIGAAATLLLCMTGHNFSTIAGLTTAHQRPDGHAGAATALVELLKPRRGTRHAAMTAALQSTSPGSTAGEEPSAGPSPQSPPEPQQELPHDRVDLSTPFGVFSALLDLGGPARARSGGDGLFAHWNNRPGRGRQGRFRDQLPRFAIRLWSENAAAESPSSPSSALPRIDSRRLRVTWMEIHQRPVAHTPATLANEYLARNRGNLAEYQRVVARVLEEQVAQARSRAPLPVLSEDDVRLAATDPQTVAARHGLDVTTVRELVAGKLDTVLAGCTDNRASPYTEAGTSCTASFLLCLSCRCARATPAHLPIQVLVHDGLAAHRPEMTPLRWAQHFAGPFAQLSDLLDRFPEAMLRDARTRATNTDHALVQRFLSRGLDHA